MIIIKSKTCQYFSFSGTCQLFPEKLKLVKKEIPYLQERGFISCSKSPISYALNMVPNHKSEMFYLFRNYGYFNQ